MKAGEKDLKFSKNKLGRKYLFIDEDTRKNIINIRKLRVEKKLSVRQLSELTGIKQHCLYDYEQGRCYPTIGNYMRLAQFFNWPIEKNPNYIFYHEFFSEKTKANLKIQREKYHFSLREIAREANLNFTSVRNVLLGRFSSSVLCFDCVQKVFAEEKRRADVRRKIESR